MPVELFLARALGRLIGKMWLASSVNCVREQVFMGDLHVIDRSMQLKFVKSGLDVEGSVPA